MSDETPKLRMAAPDSAEQIARQIARDKLTLNREREFGLEQSLGHFRVGSVKALNAVPLTRGIEDQVIYEPPSKLAEMLRRDQLDAALVSIVEPLLNDRYDILDGVAVASLGEVKSVFLAHRKSLEQATEVFCDTASLTSVMLLKVLLAERGLKPEFTGTVPRDHGVAAGSGRAAARDRPRCHARGPTADHRPSRRARFAHRR
jgi:chorismate dehydratase